MFAKGGDKAKAKREERARLKAEATKGKSKSLHEGDNLFTPESPSPSTSTSNIESKSKDTNPKSTKRPQIQSQAPAPGYFHTVPSLPPILPNTTTTFTYPSTPQQKANLQTFSTLSSLQYRMGLGPRFGGEYLIYPGDYLRYHAHFTSQVVRDDEPIRPMEIVAWGRLGTGTKKAGLICCVTSESSEKGEQDGPEDEEKGGVEFYSLEWANFG